jgi:hypothetical protein
LRMASKSLPRGLITGKSLMSVAIVVENAFRPVNGRLDRQQLGLSRIRQICQ